MVALAGASTTQASCDARRYGRARHATRTPVAVAVCGWCCSASPRAPWWKVMDAQTVPRVCRISRRPNARREWKKVREATGPHAAPSPLPDLPRPYHCSPQSRTAARCLLRQPLRCRDRGIQNAESIDAPRRIARGVHITARVSLPVIKREFNVHLDKTPRLSYWSVSQHIDLRTERATQMRHV